jgi:bifunctional non-homologous end joining protein LigD
VMADVKTARVRRTPEPVGNAISIAEFLERASLEGDVIVEADGHRVCLTSLDKVYWPDENITKGALLRYYAQISEVMLPYVESRPAILQRWPQGVKAKGFFQHDLDEAPEFLRAVRLTDEEDREIDYAVYSGLASLLYLVNLGTIEQHPFLSRVEDLEHPDWLVLDLDPGRAPWEHVLKTALVARDVLGGHNLKGYPKTSGSKGIHIVVPLEPVHSYPEIAEYAHDLAREIADRASSISTVERSVAGRTRGQVYVDWLQNARGKTLAAPYSARARPGATVSMPLRWEQVESGVRISDFTVQNVPARVLQGDPWEGFFGCRQRLG